MGGFRSNPKVQTDLQVLLVVVAKDVHLLMFLNSAAADFFLADPQAASKDSGETCTFIGTDNLFLFLGAACNVL